MYAYLKNNVVRELIAMNAADLEHFYPAEFRAHCAPCGNEVEQGWIYDGVNFAPPPAPPLEEVKKTALEALKQTRLAHEYAGPLVPVGGQPVRFPSEVKDETRLNSLSLMFAADPTLEVPDWKVADDVYVTMTAPLLMQIRAAGSLHIAVCFSVERMKREEIKALDSAEAVAAWLSANLETGWPE